MLGRIAFIVSLFSYLWIHALRKVFSTKRLLRMKGGFINYLRGKQEHFITYGNSTMNQDDYRLKALYSQKERQTHLLDFLLILWFCIFTFHLVRTWRIWLRAAFLQPAPAAH